MASWFDENASALEAANISREEAENFISRNEGDYHRVFEAFAPEATEGGGGGGGLPSANYTPWTRSFSPSLGALPADLMQPITERFTPTALPADIMDPWTREFEAPDPSQLQENPVVQARLALGRDAAEKSAAARGTLFTGGFAKGLNQFGQQVASEEYDNIYNRARGEFLDAFGIFSGDRSRREGVVNNQNVTGLNAFNANTGLTLADRGQRAGIYGQQWERDFAKEGFDYGVHKENQTIPFGMATTTYGLGQDDRRIGQDDRRIGQDDRALDESMRMGGFNRDRLSSLDQWSKYTYQDSMDWAKELAGLQYGQPS